MKAASCWKTIIFLLLVSTSEANSKGDFKSILINDGNDTREYAKLNKCLVVTKSASRLESQSCTKHVECPSNDKSLHACAKVLRQLETVFQEEPTTKLLEYENVFFSGHWFYNAMSGIEPSSCAVIVIPKPKLDRSCLLTPLPIGPSSSDVNVLEIKPGVDLEDTVEFVNDICNTQRDVNGKLNMKGHHKQYILNNLYSVGSKTSWILHKSAGAPIAQCEKTFIKSWDQFFADYLQISKPVIITGATDGWKAHTKWTKEFLRHKYGNRTVHIKMSPTKDYEGIESADLWDNYDQFAIPEQVKEKLKFPDLVVPRPAPVNMNFTDFLDLIENIANGTVKNASAYLEYSSIKSYFPEMLEDVNEMPFVKGKLKLLHSNLWLSDGDTVGKLHFDPFDNFLCMIDGKKELIIFEPHHSEQLYEAHIPEAEFSVDMATLKFSRHQLTESTSMVMSPIDLDYPNVERFPLFEKAKPLNCTINEGEVLFMPAFWWHEVRSSPNKLRHRNLAVNYWYEPFLTKEFPCTECKLNVNPAYNHLL